MKEEMYPSIKELIPDVLLARIPSKLVDEITERYETLGIKYLSDRVHYDGRKINDMMYSNRIDNCREEVVDAVFCILGWIFKAYRAGVPYLDNAFTCLTNLTEVYAILFSEREINTNAYA